MAESELCNEALTQKTNASVEQNGLWLFCRPEDRPRPTVDGRNDDDSVTSVIFESSRVFSSDLRFIAI